MTDKTARVIRAVYGTALTVSAIIAGLCLMGGALSIYQSGGEQIYTAQKVAAAFQDIAVPVWLFVALAALGFLLEAILPPRPKAKNVQLPYMVRKRLLRKADMTYCGPQVGAAIYRQVKRRTAVTAIGFGILAVCSVIFLIYALDGSHFGSDVSSAMVSAMWVFFPCLAVPFAYGVFAAWFCKKSILAECELLKTVPKTGTEESLRDAKPSPYPIRWVLLAVAVAVLVFGFVTGGTVDVLTKAVNICTECVGLG